MINIIKKLKEKYPEKDFKIEKFKGIDDFAPRCHLTMDGVILKKISNINFFVSVSDTFTKDLDDLFFKNYCEEIEILKEL